MSVFYYTKYRCYNLCLKYNKNNLTSKEIDIFIESWYKYNWAKSRTEYLDKVKKKNISCKEIIDNYDILFKLKLKQKDLLKKEIITLLNKYD